MICSAQAQLLRGEAHIGIGNARQLLNFVLHFGSAVGTA